MGRSNEEPDVSPRPPALGKYHFMEMGAVTITLSHFSAAAVFALLVSIVFGITHRENTRDMIRYGAYCFVMFLGGLTVAGWAMWLLKR